MPTFPLRKLGGVGVITDANPYDLPPNAFSEANNVIFDEERITRAPVFKQLFNPIRSALSYDAAGAMTYDSNTNPYDSAEGGSSIAARFVSSYADPINGESVFVCDNDGTIRAYPGNALTFLTPPSGLVTNDNVWSHAQVSSFSFLTRAGMVPQVRDLLAGGVYTSLVGDWPAADQAVVARPFLDYVVLFNVTKAGKNYPTMVKWCNPIQFGAAKTTINWDPANPAYLAGENVLSEMRTPIRDALMLGNTMVIYNQSQSWLMDYSGDTNVFNFRRSNIPGGVVNTNCVVEVEGKHYVFGENDIYVHDTVQRESIADTKVRRRIFNTLDRKKLASCFVVHDSVANLIHFCYRTLQDEASFSKAAFCNQAAIFNYKNNSWSFMDLPNIIGGAEANAQLVKNSYPDVTDTYELYNTSYTAYTGIQAKMPIMLSVADQNVGITDTRVFAVDLPTAGLVNLPANTEALKTAWVERTGVDLDGQGFSTLRAYKLIQSMVPQMSFEDSTGTFDVSVGCADLVKQTPNYQFKTNFNPATDYKIDMMVAGRYLAYRISTDSISNFQISGMDFDLKSMSRR
jgi:hypothetical protein